jgi:hypothetical protein
MDFAPAGMAGEVPWFQLLNVIVPPFVPELAN